MNAKLLLGAVVVLVIGGASYSWYGSQPKEAVPFQLYSTGNKLVSLEELRGKVVVLDFWASWCPPCRAAIPCLQRIHETYQDRGVTVLGINVSDKAPPAETMRSLGAKYTCLVNGEQVAGQYGVRGIPTLVVIDPEGRVILRDSGWGGASEQKIVAAIEKGLLSAQP